MPTWKWVVWTYFLRLLSCSLAFLVDNYQVIIILHHLYFFHVFLSKSLSFFFSIAVKSLSCFLLPDHSELPVPYIIQISFCPFLCLNAAVMILKNCINFHSQTLYLETNFCFQDFDLYFQYIVPQLITSQNIFPSSLALRHCY